MSKRNKILIAVIVVIGLVVVGGITVHKQANGKASFPLEHEDLIVRYAREFQLDPYLVAAVIQVESGFQSDAVSGAGAIGLMQIMPDTGEWIAGKLDVENYQKEMLLDPDINIRFGCWYLEFLMERFHGNRQLIMAGYNAGHNRVASWLEDSKLSDSGEMLNTIPFQETEEYVEKIDRAYDKYKELYEIG